MSGLQAPKILNGASDDGSIVISHKEFLGDVRSSDTPLAFAISSYIINPGSKSTFPWLSQLGKNFQEYRIEGLAFHFRSMSADALSSTNTALGSVMMCTQYDPTLPDPLSKQQMENIEFAQSVKPSLSCLHYVECAKNQTPLTNLYVAPDPEQTAGDARFYNFAKFFIATQGLQGEGVNIGELWVTYQIRLFKPMLYDALGNDNDFFQINSVQSVSEEALTVYKDNPLGTFDWASDNVAYSLNPSNTIKPLVSTGTYVRFPTPATPKTYLISLHYNFNEQPGKWDVNNVTLIHAHYNYKMMNGGSRIQAPNDDASETASEELGTIEVFVNIESADLPNPYWQFGITFTHLGTTTLVDPVDFFQFTLIEVPFVARV